MSSILIQVTAGPDQPTKAALGFLLGKTALEEGHEVNIFLAGDAVMLIQEGVLENLSGLGTGKLLDHYEAIVAEGVVINLSKMACESRGIKSGDLINKPLKKSTSEDLLELALSSDKVLCY